MEKVKPSSTPNNPNEAPRSVLIELLTFQKDVLSCLKPQTNYRCDREEHQRYDEEKYWVDLKHFGSLADRRLCRVAQTVIAMQCSRDETSDVGACSCRIGADFLHDGRSAGQRLLACEQFDGSVHYGRCGAFG